MTASPAVHTPSGLSNPGSAESTADASADRAAPSSPATSARAGRPKGGRPKAAPPDARRSVVQALLTAAEREVVRRSAADSGLTVSAYARRRLLGRPVAPLVDGRAQRELNRIGVNLNQLVRAANGGTAPSATRPDAEYLVAEARAAVAEVREAVQRLGRSTDADASEAAR